MAQEERGRQRLFPAQQAKPRSEGYRAKLFQSFTPRGVVEYRCASCLRFVPNCRWLCHCQPRSADAPMTILEKRNAGSGGFRCSLDGSVKLSRFLGRDDEAFFPLFLAARGAWVSQAHSHRNPTWRLTSQGTELGGLVGW